MCVVGRGVCVYEEGEGQVTLQWMPWGSREMIFMAAACGWLPHCSASH